MLHLGGQSCLQHLVAQEGGLDLLRSFAKTEQVSTKAATIAHTIRRAAEVVPQTRVCSEFPEQTAILESMLLSACSSTAAICCIFAMDWSTETQTSGSDDCVGVCFSSIFFQPTGQF